MIPTRQQFLFCLFTLLLITVVACNNGHKEMVLDCDRSYNPRYDSIFVKLLPSNKDTLVELIPKNLHVFTPCRSIKYEVIFSDSKNDVKFSSAVNLFIPGKHWAENRKQDEVIWGQIDHMKNKEAYKTIDQIKELDIWSDRDMTGVIENDRKIFLHPFRSNEFEILQFLPFPLVEKPLSLNKEYFMNISLFIPGRNQSSCNFSYNVVKLSELAYKGLNLPVWEIHATSLCDTMSGSLILLYSDDYGFVKMDYGYEELKIGFEMVDANFDF